MAKLSKRQKAITRKWQAEQGLMAFEDAGHSVGRILSVNFRESVDVP